MGIPYEVIVSSENGVYMAWQTQMFCISAWTSLQQWPTIIVHGLDEPLRPEFRGLQECGCRVIRARSYASTGSGLVYPPRNELGSLLELASIADLTKPILFCEPDMLFARKLDYSGSLAAEFYPYLRYDEARVLHVARRFGVIHLIKKLNEDLRIGVPYLIPLHLIRRLACRWIEVLDAFAELKWIDIMYAFGIAVAVENLQVEVTHMMTDNSRPMRPVRGLIHYGMGSSIWDKRQFRSSSPLESPDETLPLGLPGTVLGEIMRQVRHAKFFLRDRSMM